MLFMKRHQRKIRQTRFRLSCNSYKFRRQTRKVRIALYNIIMITAGQSCSDTLQWAHFRTSIRDSKVRTFPYSTSTTLHAEVLKNCSVAFIGIMNILANFIHRRKSEAVSLIQSYSRFDDRSERVLITYDYLI